MAVAAEFKSAEWGMLTKGLGDDMVKGAGFQVGRLSSMRAALVKKQEAHCARRFLLEMCGLVL